MKNKKKVSYKKPLHYKHVTQSKKKNMIGNNPEVRKRQALRNALNISYTSNSTSDPGYFFTYNPNPAQDDPGT